MPPPESALRSDAKTLELAGKLKTAMESGDVKAGYKAVLDGSFGKLSEANTELYLFLKAIECYLKQGKPEGNEMARVMATMLRERLAVRSGVQSLQVRLTNTETKAIEASPEAAHTATYIKGQFARWGY